MSFRIKNWKLAILAFIFIVFFTGLGCWQLARATEKKSLLASYEKRMQQLPLAANQINTEEDLRFYRTTLVGSFENQHTVLLDNKTLHGQVGYEVYTPFKVKDSSLIFLVDRGFVPAAYSRNQLPRIDAIIGTISITGLINKPPTYVALGKMVDTHASTPLRVQYINLSELSTLLKLQLAPYTLSAEPNTLGTYKIEWQIVIMPPEKHLGYAVQWFALALTLLILFVVLNRDRAR